MRPAAVLRDDGVPERSVVSLLHRALHLASDQALPTMPAPRPATLVWLHCNNPLLARYTVWNTPSAVDRGRAYNTVWNTDPLCVTRCGTRVYRRAEKPAGNSAAEQPADPAGQRPIGRGGRPDDPLCNTEERNVIYSEPAGRGRGLLPRRRWTEPRRGNRAIPSAELPASPLCGPDGGAFKRCPAEPPTAFRHII